MFHLPKREEDRVTVLNQMRNAADMEILPFRVQWLVNHWWLQGYRNLRRDYLTGSVDANFFNYEDADLDDLNGVPRSRVRIEEVVVKYQAELGRLLKMDIRPSAARKGFGLDSIRKAAAARVILEYLTGPVCWDTFKLTLFPKLLTFGCAGIGCWARASTEDGSESKPQIPSAEDDFTGRDQSVDTDLNVIRGLVDDSTLLPTSSPPSAIESRLALEVIPPWQLLPIPHRPTTPDEVEGIIRRRWVTLDWLKSRSGLKLPRDQAKLNLRDAPYGIRPDPSSPIEVTFMTGYDARTQESNRTGSSGRSSFTQYAQLEEYFLLHDEKDRLCRWIVKVGDHICADYTYEDRSVYMPIGISRYHPTGGFYGRSFVELLIPLNQEQEEMASILFDTVKDLSAFGTQLVPANIGISKEELTQHRHRNKVLLYEPDPTVDTPKILSITPVNFNDFPGKVMSVASQMIDRLTQQNDLMRGEAPGRVDSAQGLAFLHETGSTPLGVPANSIAQGLTQVYREILAAAPDLLSGRQALPLLGIDDNLVGLVVNPEDGTIRLNATNFPSPSEVELGVRDKLPGPPTLREQKLLSMLKAGIINPVEFRFTVWKENLDIPVANWAEQESFRKATLQVLLLFGDGEEPGQIIASTAADQPEIHLMVISQFMAKIEFQYASTAVREAFEKLKQTYMSFLGRGYPDQLPYPEDAATLEQQAGPPGGMPPSMGGGMGGGMNMAMMGRGGAPG